MYKIINHKKQKHPVRISNTVLGEWQEETGKTDMKKMTFKDLGILLFHSLKAGHRFAKKEFKLTELEVEEMVDDQKTVGQFLKMIPEFFNTGAADQPEETPGNPPQPSHRKT